MIIPITSLSNILQESHENVHFPPSIVINNYANLMGKEPEDIIFKKIIISIAPQINTATY